MQGLKVNYPHTFPNVSLNPSWMYENSDIKWLRMQTHCILHGGTRLAYPRTGISDKPRCSYADSLSRGLPFSLTYLKTACSSREGLDWCKSSAAAASSIAMKRLSNPNWMEASGISGATWDLNSALDQSRVCKEGKHSEDFLFFSNCLLWGLETAPDWVESVFNL